ncbi:hypothetical protein QP597_12160 [Providencia stuartii]|nr:MULTISPECIES: hypothetical protein [Providencia]MDK7737124.1 hypothetical protein [Providencia stuartii]MDT1067613.1 hypothetical protein [Providencia stuartii]
MTQPFDFDKTLKLLQEGQVLIGKGGILTPLRLLFGEWYQCQSPKWYH